MKDTMKKPESNRSTLTREKYIEDLKQRAHFDVVSFKAGTASCSDVVSWTNRNTGCDVISLVTTSRPFLHGSMKDLQLKLEKAHKYVSLSLDVLVWILSSDNYM